MVGEYDFLAKYYSRLSYFFLGREYLISQSHFLEFIEDKGSILIIGGGSGEILKQLSKKNTTLTITYIEASKKMLLLAQQNVAFHQPVRFIHSDTLTNLQSQKFDFVVCNFIFDHFSKKKLNYLLNDLIPLLKIESKLIYTDFSAYDSQKWWQKSVYNLMRGFIFITCKGIRSYNFNIPSEIIKSGFEVERKSTFKNNFIEAILFKYSPAS